MKTSDLIAALATQAGPAPRALAARRLLPAMLAGALAATALALGIAGPAPELGAPGGGLWLKLAYPAALAVAAAWLAARLARPAAAARPAAWLVAGVVAVVLLAGIATLVSAPPGQRLATLIGHSWTLCPWAVLVLSVPGLAGAVWALRGLAPTRPRAAGFAAGLLAGALGAFGYAFACEEPSTAFIAAWYTVGIAMAGALGAALGPRALRW